MIEVLRELRKKLVIGFVGGSDFAKISEQLSVGGKNSQLKLTNKVHADLNEAIQLSTTSIMHLRKTV